MLKRLNKLTMLLMAFPLLFSCTNTTNDITGTKTAEVVGFDTKLYLDIDGNYNQFSPLLCDESHIYDVEKTNSYHFVVDIKIDGGSSLPKIPSSSFSIVYDEQELNLVGKDYGEYLPLYISYSLLFTKDFILSPIVVKLGEFNQTIVLRNK
ncbi:MAG: hypothetical protein J6I84_08825 [Bacilli bacterium]|nr:hypothetical protein [Bacilli bacterium]